MGTFLQSLLQFFSLLAAQTATKIDDQLVVLIKTILDDPLVKEWFDKLVGAKASQPDGTLSLEADIPPEVVERFSAAGIGGDLLKTLLPILLEFILKWLRGQQQPGG